MRLDVDKKVWIRQSGCNGLSLDRHGKVNGFLLGMSRKESVLD